MANERLSDESAPIAQQRFVVLDRDGTIIVEKNYLSEPDQVELLPGVVNGLQKLVDIGLGLVVVTNQSGIGRGFFTESKLKQINQRMTNLLSEHGIVLDGIYHCPHTPQDDCQCRKPRTGLLDMAAKENGFDPAACFVVGDKESDIELGKRAGATTILVTTGYGQETANNSAVQPDFTLPGLEETTDTILGLLNLSPGLDTSEAIV